MEKTNIDQTVSKPFTYYNPDGTVRTELFSTVAEQKGRALVKKKSEKMKGGKGQIGITPTQIRRFFDEVKGIQRYLNQFQPEEKEAAFKRKLPEIVMLKAKVTYARGRDALTDEFKGFIEENVALVKEVKDFEVFCKFFEAVYGYFYFHSPRKD